MPLRELWEAFVGFEVLQNGHDLFVLKSSADDLKPYRHVVENLRIICRLVSSASLQLRAFSAVKSPQLT